MLQIILKPAPRGVGVVAGDTARTVLELAGVKDVWTFARGRTRDIYNTSLICYISGHEEPFRDEERRAAEGKTVTCVRNI